MTPAWFRPAWILVLAAALAAQDTRPTSVTLTEIARHGQGALYAAGSQRVLCLKGSPYETGLQHGRLLAAEVRTVVAETLEWTYAHGLSRAELAEIRKAAAPFVPARYTEEMRGLAEGSGAAFEDVVLTHMMPSRFHCTGAAAVRTATKDGKVYHLRSLDYALDIGTDSRLQEHALLIVREDEDGIPSVVPSWAGVLGAVTGMNGAGIAVGEMGSQCQDEDQRGIPMIFLVREVLRRATTLAQATAIFREGPATCGYHFVVSSGDERAAAALEVSRSHFAVFGTGDARENVAPHTALRDVVRRANHFVDPVLAATQRDVYDPRTSKASSWQAYARMTTFLSEHQGRLDAQALIALLRLYPKAHGCLHQAVLCPSDRELWIAQARDDRSAGFPGAQNQDSYGYDLRALLRRDLSVRVRIDAVGTLPSQPARRVVVQNAGKSCTYELEAVADDAKTVTLAAEPSLPGAFPRLELHVPLALAKGARGLVLFSSAESNLLASRVVADALARAGIATLIVPVLCGDPQSAATAITLAKGLFALLPEPVAKEPIGYFGLGLGAGSALAAALRDDAARHVVLAFTTSDLAERVASDADTAAWLGILSAKDRARIGQELAPLAASAAGKDLGPRRVLCLLAKGERHLPAADQTAFAARFPGAELWWHEGSVRSLQKDASALAATVAAFLRR